MVEISKARRKAGAGGVLVVLQGAPIGLGARPIHSVNIDS
jgi:hypothetical protein